MKGRSFFDTNVLVYRDDAAYPDKQKISVELLESCWKTNNAIISTQVLQEYFAAATRKLGVPVDIARRKVQLYSGLGIASIDHDDILQAIDLLRLYKFSFWDSLIIQMAQKTACCILYSEDMQHEQKIGDLTIINPFCE